MSWWDDICETVGGVVEAVKEVVEAVVDFVVDLVEKVVKAIDEEFGDNPPGQPKHPCPKPPEPPKVGNLTVTVVDGGGKPIPGATVVVEDENGNQRIELTDENGNANFESLDAGRYTITADKEGFETGTKPTTVAPDQTQQETIQLKSVKAVNPKITPNTPFAVLVKKPQTTPLRQMIVLSVDEQMTGGSGTIVASPAAKVKFFDAATAGNEVAQGTVFPHTKVNPSITLFVEGLAASDKKDDVEIKFIVTPSAQPAGPPATVKVTVVEITLDIHRARTDKTKDPDVIEEGKKFSEGRFVHEQDATNTCARARVTLRRAKPKDFDGNLDIAPIDGKVVLFAAETGAAPAATAAIKNTTIDEKKGFVVFAEGKTVSAALRDTGARAGLAGIDPEGDKVAITVYKVKKIEAELAATPKKRDGTDATQPKKSSTADSKTFDATAIHLVRGCGDVKLKADVEPAAGLTIKWFAERASDDVKSLKGEPALQADGADTTKQILKTDADVAGSFHISAYVDDNASNKREDEEGGITLNVHLIKIEIPAGAANNKIITRTDKYNNTRSTAGTLIVDSGSTGGIAPGVNASYTDAEFTKHPLAMKVTVKMTGGGANQRRGTDKVHLGFIQTTHGDSFVGTYADGKTLKEVIAVNAAIADPIVSGTPAMLAFPVRDTRGASTANTGPYIISSSDNDKKDLAGGGLQRICRYVDPPAIALNMTHPVTASALASFAGSNDFSVFLSAFSDDFDKNYTVLASAQWVATYGTFTAAGGWTKTGAAITTSAQMTAHNPPLQGSATNAERHPPNFVDNLKMDAR